MVRARTAARSISLHGAKREEPVSNSSSPAGGKRSRLRATATLRSGGTDREYAAGGAEVVTGARAGAGGRARTGLVRAGVEARRAGSPNRALHFGQAGASNQTPGVWFMQK